MRVSTPWLVLLSAIWPPLSAAADTPAAAHPLLPLVDACIARASAIDPDDRESLAKTCPALQQALAGAQNPHWRIVLKAQDEADPVLLHDLRASLLSAGAQPRPLPLDHAGLKALLDDTLVKKPEKTPSLRERLLEWLKSLFPEASDKDLERWAAFLKAITPPEWVIELIWRLSIAGVLLLALWLVVNEIPWARLGFQRRADGETPADEVLAPDSRSAHAETAIDIERADAPALWRYAIRLLQARGLLPERASATVRELFAAVRQPAPDYENIIKIIGLYAERQLFAARGLSDPEIKEARAAARTLSAAPRT